ncbi:MAG: hypothetical protein OXI92_04025 [Acidobacteriota bacterium]|nr:hypothetical protein [Acidobacteriota bacterium]MDE2755701.1 hypothetical protein [Acidobacteriota bacterium]
MTPRLTTGIVLASVVLLSLGCRSAEQRQSDETREALLGILDEVEEVYEKHLAATKTAMEIYEGSEVELKGFFSTGVITRSDYEEKKKKLSNEIAALRTDVKEYTDLELPRLAQSIRGVRSIAERFYTSAEDLPERAKKTVQQAKEAHQRAAARRKTRSTSKSRNRLASKPRGLPVSTPKKVAAKPAPPPPDLEELRKTYSARIEKLDRMHEELIEVLTEVQAAQTDYWEKRWAGDRVTMARLARRQNILPLRPKLQRATDLGGLNLVRRSIEIQENNIRPALAQAKKKLEQVQVQEK